MKEVIVVGAVIQDEKKRVLCALRSPSMSLPNYWEFPGGKVEKGEGYPEALIREIQEELACDVIVKEKITEVTYDYENIRVHLHTYLCRIKKGTPVAKEHAQLEWVALEKLMNLTWAPADIPTLHIITER
ncbi:(deoxy)nucleoside triphosphate pyrophosphohydrolase [Alkalihalobacillus deserti]|uniref:(deoxy)nucleoside triphosphate pyrophosphohydrolase n=1 Tax=Alkalihalobacillus deserti TaxID=2879466 RepID=UPI001D14FB2C|nr:(deoxy)nucleoside triphosphate pyrophosphohydrolase [Alkalihalobacillus deserti]